MALMTALDRAKAAAIFAAYGLELESLTALPDKGTVNSNFRCRASGQSWFLRINEGKTEAHVEREAVLVGRLRAAGFPTPEIVARVADAPVSVAGKPVTLFPWLEGREARAGEVKVAGEGLGRLHRAAATLGDFVLPDDQYSLAALEGRLDSLGALTTSASASAELVAEVGECAALIGEELALAVGERASARAQLPRGLVHQDLFPDNVLVDGHGALLAVLDLEQATAGAWVYDLAVAILAWAWDDERHQPIHGAEAALLAAYQHFRPLSDGERVALPSELRLAAARFLLTRLTDVTLRPGVDPDLRRRKDHRHYLARLLYWRGRA